VSAFSAASVFVRQRITGRFQRVGFVAIILAMAVVAVWGLNPGKAPDQLETPVLASDNYSPLDPAEDPPPAELEAVALSDEPLPDSEVLALSDPPASTDSLPPPDEPPALVEPDPPALVDGSEPLNASEPTPVPEVKISQTSVNRVSGLLASHRARAVYSGTVNGRRRAKVEFLANDGAVSDVYSEDALSRHGWKMSINLKKRTATLRNTTKITYVVPLVDNSRPSYSYAKNSHNRMKYRQRTASRSKLSSTGDYLGVTYLKNPKK